MYVFIFAWSVAAIVWSQNKGTFTNQTINIIYNTQPFCLSINMVKKTEKSFLANCVFFFKIDSLN